ncbi:tRNA (cytidine(34)-2'-O)-methyltransferase [Verrucomicrobium sp. BvORR106]|uniref:tRNA (cytidine(34)-2'-O)-methyltransferase n=1 Tax=Verrucomicrobium sp. BvORR106 TaxID=1403819 RepID=UPI0005703129|nr:tRNA (cytidine(34)-2'-O)-methyltransferase [Verrucomicrobium sp. BvORR106]
MLHIVLYQPEIPHNTGAVGRLCLATGARLHLIKPLGFSIDDKQLKRAGLDYWKDVDVRVWDRFEDLQAEAAPSGAPFYYLTTKTTQTYWNATFPAECYLVFGPETRGLPESLLAEQPAACLRIPMLDTRSLNLATAVGIVLYEAVRQTGSVPTPQAVQ